MYRSIIRDPGGSDLVRIVSGIEAVDGSKLIVPASTVAILTENGTLHEAYGPGSHVLSLSEKPWFVRLKHIMTHGDPGISVSVFFVSENIPAETTIGTGNIIFKEKTHGLSMTAGSALKFRYSISDAQLFLSRLVGMYRASFYPEDLDPAFTSLIAPLFKAKMSEVLRNCDINDLNANLIGIAAELKKDVASSLRDIGLRAESIAILSVDLDPKDFEEYKSYARQQAKAKIDLQIEKNKAVQDLELGRQKGIQDINLERIQLNEIYGGDVMKRIIEEAAAGSRKGADGAPSAGAGGDIGKLLLLMALNPALADSVMSRFQGIGRRTAWEPAQQSGPAPMPDPAPEPDPDPSPAHGESRQTPPPLPGSRADSHAGNRGSEERHRTDPPPLPE